MPVVPRPAFLLGWAGVLPFAALTAAIALGIALPADPAAMLLGYGVAILSFMGGAQWGLAVRAKDGSDRGWRGYAVSVLPALLAWAALGMPVRIGLASLAAGFACLLAYDLWTVRRGTAPEWYGRLRAQLTAAVVLLLCVAAVAR